MINDLEIPSADGNVIFVDDTTAFEIIEKYQPSSTQLMGDEVFLWSNDNMFQVQLKKCKELRMSFIKIPWKYNRRCYHSQSPGSYARKQFKVE